MKISDEVGIQDGPIGSQAEKFRCLSKVEEAQRKFEDICNNAPVAYFTHDSRHRILDINRRAVALFGLSEPERTYYLSSLVSQKSLSLLEYHLRRVVDGRPAPSIELVLQEDADVPVTVFAETSLLSPGVYQTVMVDISSQKKIERERSEFESMLLQSQKLEILYQLSGGIAHDFNNLLQVMRMQVDSALHLSAEKDESVRKAVSQISDSVERGSNLTRRLLAFSRQAPLEKVRGDLNDFVEASITMIDRAIGDSIDLSFAPSDEPLNVWIDPVQIEQVLFNLCLNSRDATDGKGAIVIQTSSVDIKVPVKRPGFELYVGPYTKMSVSDEGAGIPAELLDRAFEPFVTSKGIGEGTGLGLAIAYNVLKQHEGAIEIRETSSTGTTFDIYLPRFRDSSVLDGSSQFRSRVDGRRLSRKKRGVLVVDDEQDIRVAIEHLLLPHGVEVFVAKDGEEAIELLDQNPGVDCLLTDVVMPGKGGLEVCEHFRQKNPLGTVFLMSGHGDSVLDRDFLRHNNASFIQKPFEISSLAQKLGFVDVDAS